MSQPVCVFKLVWTQDRVCVCVWDKVSSLVESGWIMQVGVLLWPMGQVLMWLSWGWRGRHSMTLMDVTMGNWNRTTGLGWHTILHVCVSVCLLGDVWKGFKFLTCLNTWKKKLGLKDVLASLIDYSTFNYGLERMSWNKLSPFNICTIKLHVLMHVGVCIGQLAANIQ